MAYSTYLKYARALIDVVVERDIEDRIEREMEAFQVLLADHELLRGTLETPALPFQSKRRIVEELASRLEGGDELLERLRQEIERVREVTAN